MALMDATADTGVLTLRVLANDDPVQVVGSATFERAVDARQDTGRTDVGVLIKTLTNFQPQAPQRDVIGNVRVTGRTEQNGVLVTQCVQTVFGHHDAMRSVVIAAPVEVLELEAK